jgi:Tfp pilus assembly protein PilO
MKALYSVTGRVPWARIAAEHRTALLPLAVVLAANLVALAAVVYPLGQRVSTNEQRAEMAERQRVQAAAEFRRAETLRDSQTQATKDLETFYAEVLPSNVGAARRVLQLRLQQMARDHGVLYQGSGTIGESIRGSSLLRLTMSVRLAGEYDDIRSFLYDLERSTDFVVVDNIKLAEGTEPDAPLAVFLQVSTYYRAPDVTAALTGGNGREPPGALARGHAHRGDHRRHGRALGHRAAASGGRQRSGRAPGGADQRPRAAGGRPICRAGVGEGGTDGQRAESRAG